MATGTLWSAECEEKKRNWEEEIIKTDEIKRFKHKLIQNTNIT